MSAHLPKLALLVLFSAVALTLAPAPARACSAYGASIALTPWTRALTVPSEGVIVVRATDYGGELPRLVVRDAGGLEVSGVLERIDLRDPTPSTGASSYPVTSNPFLLVWRSAEPLAPDAVYSVEAVSETSWTELEPFEVTTAATAFEGLGRTPEPMSIEGVRRMVSASLRVSCDYSDYDGSGGCPTCRFLDQREMTNLEVTLDAADVDPFTIHRLVPETEGAIERDARMWIGETGVLYADVPTGVLHFDVEAEEYCFHIESESLVDGSVATGPSRCVSAADVTPLPIDPLDPGNVDGPGGDADLTGEMGSGSGGCDASGADRGLLLGLIAPLVAIVVGRRRRR